MTSEGATPLYIAAEWNHLRVVQALLGHSEINPNAQLDQSGATPLYVAAQNGSTDVVRALVNKPQTNPDLITAQGASPLYIAAASGHIEIVRVLAGLPTVKLNRVYAGQSPTAAAQANGHHDCVNALTTAYHDRTATAIADGVPIPFDAQPIDLTTITNGQKATEAVVAWRAAEVPESDLQQLRRDVPAYIVHARMTPEEINVRYQHFFNPAIAIENPESRRNLSKHLLKALTVQPA